MLEDCQAQTNNLAHGVQDCSRGGNYHNKRFKEEAERRGLVISHHPTYGWTLTEPSEALIHTNFYHEKKGNNPKKSQSCNSEWSPLDKKYRFVGR